MSGRHAPIQIFHDLSVLSQAGFETHFVATNADLLRIATWADLPQVARFEAHIALRRLSRSRFSYEATLEADIVQDCVVTLEPVATHIVRKFLRSLLLVQTHGPNACPGIVPISRTAEREDPDEIDSPRFDLAAPLLEEFTLAVEPYPRAAGASFASPVEDRQPDISPFKVLDSLKRKG